MSTRILAGTSGYSYKEWLGHFYPEKLAPNAMLRYYGERFNRHADASKYTPHNRLLISIAHAMGLTEMTTFGDAQLSAGGPLDRLKA